MATMIIEGERATAASGETYQVKNPATGEVVDEVPSGGAEDVARAARAAEKNFSEALLTTMAPTPSSQRASSTAEPNSRRKE